RQIIADAGFPKGAGLPKIQIATYATMPALEAVAQMWKENLGVDAGIAVVETGIYSEYTHGKIPSDFIGFSFNYRGAVPPSLLGLVGKGLYRYAYVPYDVAREYFEIARGDQKSKYSPQERADKIQHLLSSNWLPEYDEFESQAQEAVA